jgi:glycosyltransferase involved in cell wall biosynthesis
MDRPERLRRAVKSVLDQTYEPLEVVVVDGSSDERTAEVLDTLRTQSGSSIRYIHNDEPQGLPAARNQGIEVTDADLLAFLDDDDEWYPEKTEQQVTRLQEVGADAVYTGFVSRREDGSHIHTRRPTLPVDIYEALLVRNVVGPPSTVLVRRVVLESVGRFDESLYHQEDWDLYVKLAREFDFACVSEPLVTRTVHDEMMSQSVEKQKRHREEVLERNAEELRTSGIEKEAWATHHRKAGLTHCSNGDTAAGRVEFRRSLVYSVELYTLVLYVLSLTGSRGFDFTTWVKRTVERR